jgi:hypothetical protein
MIAFLGPRRALRRYWQHVRYTRDRSYAGATDGGYHLGLYLPTSALGDTLIDARTMSLPPADDAERCLLAIELSKKSWIVAVNTPLSDKISRYRLKACDWKELLKLIERIRTRVAGELKKRVDVVSCYEAGYDGFWLHRLLEARGIRNYVIDPTSVQVDRRTRRAKTDGIDVERLLRSLMAYLRGEPKVWSVVRVPSVAEEDDRRLHRERRRLVRERIRACGNVRHGRRLQTFTATDSCTAAIGIFIRPLVDADEQPRGNVEVARVDGLEIDYEPVPCRP